MFYREVPAEKIMATAAKSFAPVRPASASDLRKRQILMWSGVIVIMAFLIVLWGSRVKENFQNNGSVKEDLNFLNKGELSDILKKTSSASVAATTTANTLNAEQINELKKKIENKNSSQ